MDDDKLIKYNDVIQFFERNLYKYTKNNALSGFIVYIVHVGICSIAAFYIFLGKVDKIFYICVALWLLIFALHFYFKGCILVKLERHLWKTKDWYGPWSVFFFPLKYFNVELSKNTTENIFICYGVIFMLFIMIKIYLDEKIV